MIHLHGAPVADGGKVIIKETTSENRPLISKITRLSLLVFHHFLLGGRFPHFQHISIKISQSYCTGMSDAFLSLW